MHTAAKKPYKGSEWKVGWPLVHPHSRQRHGGFSPASRGGGSGWRSRRGVLEVAPGPGFFAIELAKLGDFQITGLDISRTLVEIASENARAAGVRGRFSPGQRLGDAVSRRVVRFRLLLGRIQKLYRAGGGLGRNAPRAPPRRRSAGRRSAQGRFAGRDRPAMCGKAAAPGSMPG